MKQICMSIMMVVTLSAATAFAGEQTVLNQEAGTSSKPTNTIKPQALKEISLVPSVVTCDSQLQSLAAYKKELSAAIAAGADKDKAIATLRAQASESATKLAALQSTVEFEAFELLSEKASTVRLHGFGAVRLVPLLDDYLVIIPPDLAKGVDTFFAKIRKVTHVGKSSTYLICDRKYFVPAAPAIAADSDKGGQP